MKFVLKFPQQTVEYFLSRLFDSNLNRVFSVSHMTTHMAGPLCHMTTHMAGPLCHMTTRMAGPLCHMTTHMTGPLCHMTAHMAGPLCHLVSFRHSYITKMVVH